MTINRSDWVNFGEVPNLDPDADEVLEQLGRAVSLHPDPVVLSKILLKIRKEEAATDARHAAKAAAKAALEAAKKAAITEENRRLWNEYHNIEASK